MSLALELELDEAEAEAEADDEEDEPLAPFRAEMMEEVDDTLI